MGFSGSGGARTGDEMQGGMLYQTRFMRSCFLLAMRPRTCDAFSHTTPCIAAQQDMSRHTDPAGMSTEGLAVGEPLAPDTISSPASDTLSFCCEEMGRTEDVAAEAKRVSRVGVDEMNGRRTCEAGRSHACCQHRTRITCRPECCHTQ